MLSFVPVIALSRESRTARSSSVRQRDGGVGAAVALNRVLFENHEGSGTVTLPRDDARAVHVRSVLRLPREGGSVRAGVVDHFLVDDVPVAIADDCSVRFDLSAGLRVPLPVPLDVTLVLAVPRPKVLARLLPQIAAVGVRSLVLVNAFKVR